MAAPGRMVFPATAFQPLISPGSTGPTLYDTGPQAGDASGGWPRHHFQHSVEEACYIGFGMPNSFLSDLVVKVLWYTPGSSDTVRWDLLIAAITAADATTVIDKELDAPNIADVAPDGTANRLKLTEIAIANDDGLVGDDLVQLVCRRDGTHANDDLIEVIYMVAVILEWTKKSE